MCLCECVESSDNTVNSPLLYPHLSSFVSSPSAHPPSFPFLAPPPPQAANAIAFARDLLDCAANIRISEARSMELSIGIHTGAAQGVIVGANHPVMYFTGNLPDTASRMEATCPPNCIHVSAKMYETAGESSSPPICVYDKCRRCVIFFLFFVLSLQLFSTFKPLLRRLSGLFCARPEEPPARQHVPAQGRRVGGRGPSRCCLLRQVRSPPHRTMDSGEEGREGGDTSDREEEELSSKGGLCRLSWPFKPVSPLRLGLSCPSRGARRVFEGCPLALALPVYCCPRVAPSHPAPFSQLPPLSLPHIATFRSTHTAPSTPAPRACAQSSWL